MGNGATVALRPFPLIKSRSSLKYARLIEWMAKLTNNDLSSRWLNRDFIHAYSRLDIPALSPAGQRVTGDLKANGIAFANIDEFFGADILGRLVEAFDAYHEAFRKSDAAKDKGKAIFVHTVHKAHTFIPSDLVSDFLSSTDLAVIAARYLGMVPRFVGNSFWHTFPAPRQDRVYSQQWHRDYNDRQLVKVFLYLNDVDEHNGPFEYLASSHRLGELGRQFDAIGSNGYRAYPDNSAIEDLTKRLPIYKLHELPPDSTIGSKTPWHRKPSTVLCTARAGTLIFADTFGLHRGGHVEEGHRNLMMLTYSTNSNIHKPHYAVTPAFAETLSPFMRMVFGLRPERSSAA